MEQATRQSHTDTETGDFQERTQKIVAYKLQLNNTDEESKDS
jgi:hypothetical protein